MTKRRFTARQDTIIRDLRRVVVEKMQATGLRINQDVITNLAEVVFDRAGRRYVFRCNRFAHCADNLRAVGLTIDYLYRAFETYGVSSETGDLPPEEVLRRFFLGFEATPDDTVLLLTDGNDRWWDVLGVGPEASRAEVVAAYRALARVHHPDVGGTEEDFRRLRRAYEQGLAATGADVGQGTRGENEVVFP